nr:Hpt domain-containing protein [Chromobacterium subtsugae]
MRNALRRFIEEAELLANLLQLQLESGDAAQRAATLHSLKGIAATVGAAALARRAGELEQCAKPSAPRPLDADAWREAAMALQQLAKDSVRQLARRLPEPVAAAAPAAAPALSIQEWRERLQAIQPLLERGNLAAIDLATALLPLAGERMRPQVESLVAQVGRLQFAPALHLLKTLIESEP